MSVATVAAPRPHTTGPGQDCGTCARPVSVNDKTPPATILREPDWCRYCARALTDAAREIEAGRGKRLEGAGFP